MGSHRELVEIGLIVIAAVGAGVLLSGRRLRTIAIAISAGVVLAFVDAAVQSSVFFLDIDLITLVRVSVSTAAIAAIALAIAIVRLSGRRRLLFAAIFLPLAVFWLFMLGLSVFGNVCMERGEQVRFYVTGDGVAHEVLNPFGDFYCWTNPQTTIGIHLLVPLALIVALTALIYVGIKASRLWSDRAPGHRAVAA